MTRGLTSGFKLHHLINHVTLVQSYILNFRAFGKHLRNRLIGWQQIFVWAVESKQKHRWNLNTGADVNFLSLRANFQMQIWIFSTESQPSAAGSRFMNHPWHTRLRGDVPTFMSDAQWTQGLNSWLPSCRLVSFLHHARVLAPLLEVAQKC